MEENKENNPFSFKTFIKTNTTEQNALDSDIPVKKAEDKSKFESVETSEFFDTYKDDNESDNPFSFKKYYDSSKSEIPNDVNVTDKDIENPNFLDLPDVTSKTDTSFSVSESLDTGSFEEDADSNDLLFSPVVKKGNKASELQFQENYYKSAHLLETVLSEDPFSTNDDITVIGNKEELTEKLINAEKENKKLQHLLKETTQKLQSESKKSSRLQLALTELQKKEKEETAALEDIIQQVEANLTTTTERALKAEKRQELLKEEVKSLRQEVTVLTAENQKLKSRMSSGNQNEQVKYVSEQLKGAADSAKVSLNQLLEGVDKLKLFSDVLLSAEKISEVENET